MASGAGLLNEPRGSYQPTHDHGIPATLVFSGLRSNCPLWGELARFEVQLGSDDAQVGVFARFDIATAEGTGTPLVLLHGWSRWADTWWDAGYGDTLTDDYRVITIDRLGHGQSDKPHDALLYVEDAIASELSLCSPLSALIALLYGIFDGCSRCRVSGSSPSAAELPPSCVAAIRPSPVATATADANSI